MGALLTHVPEPLAYAEALLGQFSSLLQSADDATLLGDFIRGTARLSGCELAQLFLVDAAHCRLELSTECLEDRLQFRDPAGLPVDYDGEQLLQFVLRQNRRVCLGALSDSLHDTRFLPARAAPWQSLLCVPLATGDGIKGVLVCASSQQIELQGFADSLGYLGAFALKQIQLLQRQRRPAAEGRPVAINLPSANGFGLIGKSAAMRQSCQLISKVVNSPYTVLLYGETGTGKEVVARAIHDCGPRRTQAFIVQNCAALPEQLLESELFGYRKGAFTGADRDRIGLFDAADKGTLLLDEIGDMPLSLQAKLLRVLQEGEIRPLGSNLTPGSYRLRSLDGQSLPMSRTYLDQMAAAHTIRQGFFIDNPAEPQIQFKLEPYTLDPAVSRSEFRFGDKTLEYRHGPIQPLAFTWPTDAQGGRTSLLLERMAGGRGVGIEKNTGPWSLFRLFDLMQAEYLAGRDVRVLKADLGGLRANFLLTSQRTPNPFDMTALRTFRMPAQL